MACKQLQFLVRPCHVSQHYLQSRYSDHLKGHLHLPLQNMPVDCRCTGGLSPALHSSLQHHDLANGFVGSHGSVLVGGQRLL